MSLATYKEIEFVINVLAILCKPKIRSKCTASKVLFAD
jgi:hypothetical protein